MIPRYLLPHIVVAADLITMVTRNPHLENCKTKKRWWWMWMLTPLIGDNVFFVVVAEVEKTVTLSFW
jgi:hypothetical protein